jgi:hypothetical protein
MGLSSKFYAGLSTPRRTGACPRIWRKKFHAEFCQKKETIVPTIIFRVNLKDLPEGRPFGATKRALDGRGAASAWHR